MEKLRNEIEKYCKNLDDRSLEEIKAIDKDNTTSPFSKESQKLEYLMHKNILTHEEYVSLKEQFNARNKYLYLYEMTSAVCGKEVEEIVLKTNEDEFKKACKDNLPADGYSSFNKQFDLFIDLGDKGIIRVEVKSNRASSNSAKATSLTSKAKKKKEFEDKNRSFHFQQLKPACSHVFILVGIYSDAISFYVLNSDELKTFNLSPQHKGGKTDKNDPDFEGQVSISVNDLSKYGPRKDLLKRVKEKYKKLSKETIDFISNHF